MRTELFRQQVVHHLTKEQYSNILVAPRRMYFILAAALFSLTVGIILYICFAQYHQYESVGGWLESPEGTIKVFNHESGLSVEKMFVREGEIVKAGQPLMMLKDLSSLNTGQRTDSVLLEQHQRQIKLLSSRITSSKENHALALQKLRNDQIALNVQLEQLAALLDTSKAQLTLAEQQLDRTKKMQQQGFATHHLVEQSTRHQLDSQQEYQRLLLEQETLKQRSAQLNIEQQALPSIHSSELSELQGQLSQLLLAQTQRQSQFTKVINSPSEGKIAHIAIKQGQQPLDSQILLSITPTRHAVEANLAIPTRAAGRLKVGQTIKIKYDAFPFQKHGFYEGVITHIPNTISLPRELANAPISLQESVYLVRATLATEHVTVNQQHTPLKPGMKLQADIQVQVQTIIEWLLEPLLLLRGKW